LRHGYGLGQAEIVLEATVSYRDMLTPEREAEYRHAGGEQTSGLQTISEVVWLLIAARF